jgi:hypothetical protein
VKLTTYLHLVAPIKIHRTMLPFSQERLRWAGHVARRGESRVAYRVLIGKSEEKGSLERLRRRWKDNIKMDVTAFTRARQMFLS